MPSPITITVKFDDALQELTAIAEHPVVMSEGSNFSFLLMSIFSEYPDIEEKYPPGALGFTINGVSPKPYSPLFDGDIVSFSIT
jgi:hypothetical protein